MDKKIVWINGVCGIGKTTTALRLEEYYKDDDVVVLDSDKVYQEFIKKYPYVAMFFGMTPQTNIPFINEFRKEIEANLPLHRRLIVVMAITKKECKEGLIDYLIGNGIDLIHIVLVASEKTVEERIKNDTSGRDKRLSIEALDEGKRFIENNFTECVTINTETKQVQDIANEIAAVLV